MTQTRTLGEDIVKTIDYIAGNVSEEEAERRRQLAETDPAAAKKATRRNIVGRAGAAVALTAVVGGGAGVLIKGTEEAVRFTGRVIEHSQDVQDDLTNNGYWHNPNYPDHTNGGVPLNDPEMPSPDVSPTSLDLPSPADTPSVAPSVIELPGGPR